MSSIHAASPWSTCDFPFQRVGVCWLDQSQLTLAVLAQAKQSADGDDEVADDWHVVQSGLRRSAF